MSNLNQIKTTPKTGDETFTNKDTDLGFQLIDFWRWNQSDLISNSNRGKFAEFIVAMAIGYDYSSSRNEWDAYDLLTEDGIKIEVKSAAFIQSWKQFKPTKIQFNINETRAWEGEEQNIRGKLRRQADVYVMCLLKHQDQNTLNPMNLEQWEFYVVPTSLLDEKLGSQKSIALGRLKSLVESCSFNDINQNIKPLKHSIS